MRLPLLSLLLLSLLLLGRHSMAEDDFEDEDEEDGSVVDEADAEEEAEAVAPKEQIFYERPVPVDKVHFYEPFDTRAEFIKRWVYSQAKKDGADEDLAKYDGKWGLEEPRENPITNDLGLILKSKAKHHAIAANLDEPFKFSGKPFIAQYEVRFQNGQDCGGAYIKLLSHNPSFKLKTFTDKTPYTIMFGPDKCGNDHKLHFIFRHKNPKTGEYEEKHAAKPTGKLDTYFSDKKTHLYTLIIKPDNSYEVQVDKVVVMSGNLLETMTPPVNPPKEIEDPNDKKPTDWDDREKIQDPTATKPEDWDESQPAQIKDDAATMPAGWLEDQGPTIPDPEASVPEDWDESMDGEWEAPLIDNPACASAPGCGPWSPPMIANPLYKGKWSAPMIDNPDYQGEWKPKIIPNPAYFLDEQPYKMTPIGALGLELWSMSSEIAFDNFLVADNLTVVEELTQLTWEVKAKQEGASGGKGVFGTLSGWAAGRPWLWAVYLVAVLLPITLLCICLCPRSGPVKPEDIAAHRKKFDDPEPDTIPEEELEEEEEEEADGGAGEEEEVEEVEAESDPGAGGDAAAEEVKAGGGDAANDSQEGEDADVEDSVPSQDSPKKSSPRKRKTRKE